jgi:hypothetical protein
MNRKFAGRGQGGLSFGACEALRTWNTIERLAGRAPLSRAEEATC